MCYQPVPKKYIDMLVANFLLCQCWNAVDDCCMPNKTNMYTKHQIPKNEWEFKRRGKLEYLRRSKKKKNEMKKS